MSLTKRGITVIIKTTFDCNLACLYCYEGKKPKHTQIDLQTVENTITKFAQFYPPNVHISFIWHGGEPLLMGLGFFKSVLRIQEPLGGKARFRNGIQTNGLLLSSEYIEFLVENHFSIGLSLDGPPSIHDSQRLSLNGGATFAKVFDALERMRTLGASNSSRGASALAIFTRNTLEHLDEFYQFFRDNHIDVQINPLLHAGNAGDSGKEDLHINPEEYGRALVYLFDRWLGEDHYTITLDPFASILGGFVKEEPRGCTFRPGCYDNYFSIDPDGYIVPCGRWSRTDFMYGNINEDNLQDVFRSSDYERYKQECSKVFLACGSCRHYDICHGGCPFSGHMRRQQIGDPDYYCASYMMLFDHMKAVVKEQILMAG